MYLPLILIILKQCAKVGFWEAMDLSVIIDQVNPSQQWLKERRKNMETRSHILFLYAFVSP